MSRLKKLYIVFLLDQVLHNLFLLIFSSNNKASESYIRYYHYDKSFEKKNLRSLMLSGK